MSIYAPVTNPNSLGTQSNTVQPTTLPEDNQIPGYVYKLTCKPTGQFYYGSRTANIGNNKMPVDDLWVHYFASSDYVDALVEEHGKDAFEYEIIMQSTDLDAVYWTEQSLIEENRPNPNILNKRFFKQGGGKFIATSETAKKAMETKAKNGTAQLGSEKAAITCRERGITKENAQKSLAARIANGNLSMDAAVEAITKNWEMTNSNGETIIIRNLENFCREHDLDASTMGKVARGKRKSHKGWTCKQLD